MKKFIARISKSTPPFNSIGSEDIHIEAESKEQAEKLVRDSLQTWEALSGVIEEGQRFESINQVQFDLRMGAINRRLALPLSPINRAKYEAQKAELIADTKLNAPSVKLP